MTVLWGRSYTCRSFKWGEAESWGGQGAGPRTWLGSPPGDPGPASARVGTVRAAGTGRSAAWPPLRGRCRETPYAPPPPSLNSCGSRSFRSLCDSDVRLVVDACDAEMCQQLAAHYLRGNDMGSFVQFLLSGDTSRVPTMVF